MRQILLVGLATFISVQSIHAQTTVTVIQPYFYRNPTKLAIIGGYNLSTATVRVNGVAEPTQYHNSFGLGILWKSQFDGNLYFSPYAEINGRGYGYTANISGVTTKYQNSMYYLDIAPALSLDVSINKQQPNQKVVFSFSPVFSVALAGTEKQTKNGVTKSSKMKFSIDGDYGILDIGLNWSAAYQMKDKFIQIGYQLGVANIDNNAPTDNRNIQNRMLSLTLGYYLK
jgi:hypothetical protein